jgi:hypothetical protein
MRTLTAAAAVLAASCLMATAQTNTRSFWDGDGHFAGSSSNHNNTTSFSDRNGRFSGSSIRNSDGTTSLYDRNGHFTGSVTNTSPGNRGGRN